MKAAVYPLYESNLQRSCHSAKEMSPTNLEGILASHSATGHKPNDNDTYVKPLPFVEVTVLKNPANGKT
jgi:hypothetical protein